MPIVTMPDGQQVEMPDDLTPELGNRLRAFNDSLAPVKTPMMASHAPSARMSDEQARQVGSSVLSSLGPAEAFREVPSALYGSAKAGLQSVTSGALGLVGNAQEYVGNLGTAVRKTISGQTLTPEEETALAVGRGGQPGWLGIAALAAPQWQKEAAPVTKAASKQIASESQETAPAQTIAGKVASVVGGVIPHLTPLAPVTMGLEMYQQGKENALNRGASPDAAELSGMFQGTIGAVLGGAGKITKSILPELEPFLSRFPAIRSALTKEVEVGGGPVTKFLGNLVAGGVKTGTEFAAMGAANDAISEAADPHGGNPLKAAANKKHLLGSFATGLAFHAVPEIVGIPFKGEGRSAITPEESAKPRAYEDARSDFEAAIKSHDEAAADRHLAEMNTLKPKPLEGEIVDPGVPVGPDGTVFKGTSPYGLATQAPEAPTVEGELVRPTIGMQTRPALGMGDRVPERPGTAEGAHFDDRINQIQLGAEADKNRLSDLRNKLEIEQDKAKRTGGKKAKANADQIVGMIGDIESSVEDRESRINDLKSRRPIEMGETGQPDTTPSNGPKPAFREATPEEAAATGKYDPLKLVPEDEAALTETMAKRGEVNITEPTKPFEVPDQPPISPEDASRLADLHQQRMDNEASLDSASRMASKTGSKKAQAEVDNLTQNQSQIENEIAKIQLGIKGPSDVPVPEPPNPEATPAETNGLTPQGSGTSLLSNEEIMRSQRGDTYYRVDRSGSVTNLGPQPDAPVRNGEAIIMVDGETGKPQVQNSQGLGNDKVVLNKFGNRVMGVHEAGHGMIADNLGLQQLYEAGMNKAKDVLGLDRASTDGDVVRAFADKLGKLGKTAKETTVKIMNQVKGIGRDLAGAIADHLHQMVSGSRESQLGAIGPDIKAKYTEEQIASAREAQERHRARIKSAYDDPQDRARMYKQIPSVETILGKDLREEVRPVEQKAQRSVVQAVSTALRESVSEPARAIKDIWTWGGENPVVKFFNEADQRGMIQHAYEKGSGELAPLANSMITGEAPKVVKDLDYGTTTNLKKFFVSPHIIEDGVFPTGEGPTIDAQKAATHVVMMRGEATRFFQDILHPFGDNSAEMAKQISPLFKQFRKFAEQFYPLDIQQRQLMDAMKSKDAKKAGEAKVANQQWMEQNGAKYDALNTTIKKILDHRNRMIEGFAEKYADARIYLAAEGKPVAGLTGSERKAANSYKQAMQAYKAKLDAAKIPTIDDDYVPHLVRQLDPEAFQVSAISGVEKKVPEILKFAERMEDSKAWLPSAYGAASIYVPTASRKLAMQPILDKWRPMIDPNNLNGYTNPGSPNYAPNAGAYVEGMIGNMLKPRETNLVVKIVDALKAYETFRLLAFNPRTGYKHLFKLANMLGEHHVWLGPGGKDIVQARIANTPVLKGLVDNLGLTDWRAKAQLVHQFYGTREILGMLQENPFISGLSDPLESKIAGSRAAKAVGNTRLFLKNVIAQPVKSVEAFENGLNILSSIEKGRNLPFEKSMNGMILNILDYNFRGGADAAEYLKNPSSRWATMFTQTPQKLAELHAKIVRRGLAGQRDIFGSEDSAKMVRHVIALGAVAGMSAMQGINWADSMLHVAGVNTDFLKHSGKMMFYKAMAGATGKEDYSDKALENELLLLGDRGLISVSPFFGLKDEIDTLVGGGPSAWVNSMPGVKQIKAGIKGQAPIGYSTPGRYMTGTQSEEEKKAMEAWRTKRGLREKKTIMRKSAAND